MLLGWLSAGRQLLNDNSRTTSPQSVVIKFRVVSNSMSVKHYRLEWTISGNEWRMTAIEAVIRLEAPPIAFTG